MKRFWLIILALLAVFCFGACQEKPPETSKYVVVVEKNITEAGTVTGAGEYDENQLVTLTATTNEGYVFCGWYEDGYPLGTESTYSFAAMKNRTIEARWEEAEDEDKDWGSGIW